MTIRNQEGVPPGSYRCEGCDQVFVKGWSDEEAKAEQQKNGFADEDCGIVCDVCYRRIMARARRAGVLKQAGGAQ